MFPSSNFPLTDTPSHPASLTVNPHWSTLKWSPVPHWGLCSSVAIVPEYTLLLIAVQLLFFFDRSHNSVWVSPLTFQGGESEWFIPACKREWEKKWDFLAHVTKQGDRLLGTANPQRGWEGTMTGLCISVIFTAYKVLKIHGTPIK